MAFDLRLYEFNKTFHGQYVIIYADDTTENSPGLLIPYLCSLWGMYITNIHFLVKAVHNFYGASAGGDAVHDIGT